MNFRPILSVVVLQVAFCLSHDLTGSAKFALEKLTSYVIVTDNDTTWILLLAGAVQWNIV